MDCMPPAAQPGAKPGVTGSTKRPGCCSRRAAAISGGAVCRISLLRLPGSRAITVSSAFSPRAARAASRGGSIGMVPATGGPHSWRRAARCRISAPREGGKVHRPATRIFSMLPVLEGPDGERDEANRVLSPPRANAPQPEVEVGASMPMNTSGRSASNRLPSCLRMDNSSRRFSVVRPRSRKLRACCWASRLQSPRPASWVHRCLCLNAGQQAQACMQKQGWRAGPAARLRPMRRTEGPPCLSATGAFPSGRDPAWLVRWLRPHEGRRSR